MKKIHLVTGEIGGVGQLMVTKTLVEDYRSIPHRGRFSNEIADAGTISQQVSEQDKLLPDRENFSPEL
jgi:hypothetical protein